MHPRLTITCVAYWAPPPETLFLLSFTHFLLWRSYLQKFVFKKEKNVNDGDSCVADLVLPVRSWQDGLSSKEDVSGVCVSRHEEARIWRWRAVDSCARVFLPLSPPLYFILQFDPLLILSQKWKDIPFHHSVHTYLPRSHVCRGPRDPQTEAAGVHLWVVVAGSFSNYYCSSSIFLMGLLLIEG